MAPARDLRKGSVEILLLTLLEGEPMYGYELAKELRRRSRGYFEFKEGTLYPALHRMEERGWLRAQWQVVEEGPSRKYYHLTASGREELKRARQEWTTFADRLLGLLAGPPNEAGEVAEG
jgi:PadR family transcriptional regulator PadR